MFFIVISQRAKGNPNYKLNDLPGYGRFDIIPRVILAAMRKNSLLNDEVEILCMLKGSDPYGWLAFSSLENDFSEYDEMSLAAYLKRNWNKHWTTGSFRDLLNSIFLTPKARKSFKWYELSEKGEPLETIIKRDRSLIKNFVFLLGAQVDVADEDRLELESIPIQLVSLGDTPLLASQVISLVKTISSIQST